MTALSRIRSPDKDRILSQNILRSPFPPIRRSRNSGRYGMRMRRHAPALPKPRGQCLPRLPASALRIFVPAPSAMRSASSLPSARPSALQTEKSGNIMPPMGDRNNAPRGFLKNRGGFPPGGAGTTPHCSGLSIFFNRAAPQCLFCKSAAEARGIDGAEPDAFEAYSPSFHSL